MIDEMHNAVLNARSKNLRLKGWRMSPSAFVDLRLTFSKSSNFVRCDLGINKAMGLPIEITNDIDGWELQTE